MIMTACPYCRVEMGEVEFKTEHDGYCKSMPTEKWLLEMGAVRPLARTGVQVFCLGEFKEGLFPIQFRRTKREKVWQGDGLVDQGPVEEWAIYGIRCEPLTRK